jgi:peptidoglycan/LPS O-acetylase OafA/YrhL
MSGKSELRALTGIRGIAAWWIVLFHFNIYISSFGGVAAQSVIGQGYLAVDLFFELSGFIIALNYLDRFRVLTAGECIKFLGVRLARIYPLHIFMLGIFLLNPLAIALFSSGTGSRNYGFPYFILSIFLVQNWGFASSLGWNIPAWSISTEWAAYLAFPLIVWMSVRLLRSRVQAFLAMALLLILLAAFFAFTTGSLGAGIPRTGLFRCLFEFCLGICLYIFWDRSRALSTRAAYFSFALAVVLFAAYALSAIPDYVIVPLAFLCLVYALADERSFVARLMSSRLMVFMGLVSYSTYLVHFFVKDWVKFILGRDGVPSFVLFVAYIGATAAASVLLYRYIEVPGRQLVRGWITRFAARRRISDMPRTQADAAVSVFNVQRD